MSIRRPLPEIPAAPLEAAVSLRAEGRDFVVGQRFPWRQLKMDERRVRQMILARKLRPATSDLDVPDEKVKLPPLCPEAQAAAAAVRAKIANAKPGARSGA